MRLELNARAGCYNLYCDTREEHESLRLLMQQPLASTDIHSIQHMIYADTDSIKTMKTKLNSVYGKVVTDMAKEYIVAHRASNPIVIFKKSISAIEQHEDASAVIYTADATFYVDDKYADVIKQIV